MGRNLTGTIQGNENTTRLANLLKNAEVQYQPLTKDEELKLIKKHKKDRDTLNQLLILHNLRAVFNIAKKYKSKTDDFDGMVQNGFLGLAEAAKRFDPKMKIKFITYAYVWIRKYVLQGFYAKNIEVDRNSTSLNKLVSGKSKDGDTTELEDYVTQYAEPSYYGLYDINKTLSSNEQLKVCKGLMDELERDNSLSATDKEIFISLFYNREKVRDLADIYDTTVTGIHQVRDKILGKLKDVVEKKYNIHSYSEIACS